MPKPASDLYVSKLYLNGETYFIKDSQARSDIDDLKEAIVNGVHFRGVTSTAIADNDSIKDLTIGDSTIIAEDQENGDLFIYNNGTKNLEFVVVRTTTRDFYSELGSTGELGALAFADDASGSATVPIAAAITVNDYEHVTGLGTVAVTYTEGNLSTSEAETAADITYTPTSVDVSSAAAAATFGTETANAGIGSTATGASIGSTPTAASVTYTPVSVTAAGPTVNLTYTTGTFTALTDVSYDESVETLYLGFGTSDAFTKVPSVDTIGDIDVVIPVVTAVTYDKATAVTYDKATAVTYDKVSAVTYDKAASVTYDKLTAVTYDKVSASGTFLTAASLEGALAVTNAAPTLTITNPTITVTVTPNA